MIRIIGFEGTLGDAIISYGAAAIELEDGTVINSFARLQQQRESIDGSEALTTFDRPWEFEDESLQEEQLLVIAIKRDGVPSYVAELYPDTGRLGGHIKTKREKPYVFFLLRSRDAFRSYAEETASQVADAVMREALKGPDALGLIRCALTLSPRDPTLLALRVYLSPDQPAVRRTAERLLEGADDTARAVFHAVLTACERSTLASTLYIVKYEDGDQKIGGFNLDDAVKQFKAIDSLHDRLAPLIRQSLPLLPEGEALPRNRLQHFKAASAEIGFGVLGNNLRERVLRYFELDILAKLLRGEIPPELRHDRNFIADLRSVLSPRGGATLRHRPIGAEELEPVAVDLPEEDDRPVDEKQIRVLGFVQGFYREVKRAEIRISPMHVEAVSICNDGSGLSPAGTEILREGAGLFRPALFALLRRRLASGALRWFLQRMSLLAEETTEMVDTIGSAIVPKALFSPAEELEVSFDGQIVRVGTSQIRVYGHTIESCREWLEAWQRDALEIELRSADSAGSTWVPPLGFADGVGISAMLRILAVLGTEPKGVSIDQLVYAINERFNTYVRKNNTWRTVRQSPELFVEGDDDVQLTPIGLRWSSALRRYFDA